MNQEALNKIKRSANVTKKLLNFVPGPYGNIARKVVSGVEGGLDTFQTVNDNVKVVDEYRKILQKHEKKK